MKVTRKLLPCLTAAAIGSVTFLTLATGDPQSRISTLNTQDTYLPPPSSTVLPFGAASNSATKTSSNTSSSTVDNSVISSKLATHNFNLANADLQSVIDEVAKLTGKNFLIDPTAVANKKVTVISEKPMTVAEIYRVFLSALRLNGLAAVPAGRVTKIVTLNNAKEVGPPIANSYNPGEGEESVIRVLHVNNVPVSDLTTVARALLPDSDAAGVTAYAPSNTLILSGAASTLNKIADVIQQTDSSAANSVEIVPLKSADASKVVATLKELQTSDGSTGALKVTLAADKANNSILISGTTGMRRRYIHLIKQLDNSQNRATGGTEVVYLNYLNAKDLAPILSKIAEGDAQQLNSTGGLSSAPTSTASGGDSGSDSNNSTSVQAVKDSNALIIDAPTLVMRSLNKVISQLDVRPQQVLVEAVIARVDESLVNDLGIVWGTSNAQETTIGPNGLPVTTSTFQQGIGYIPYGQIRAVVHALQSNGDTDILATPTITVLNNDTATISDGENIGVQNQTYAATNPGAGGGTGTGTAGNNQFAIPFSTYQRQDVALSLKVTPIISPNQAVRMKIEQEDNTVPPDQQNNSNPNINISKITTSVLVNSNNILVLGGLISHDQEKNVDKIPILGDFPIIGNLFKRRTKSITRKDLMVFIRPVIINSIGSSNAVTKRRYNYMRNTEIAKNTGEELIISETPPTLPNIYGEKNVSIPQPFSKMPLHSDKKKRNQPQLAEIDQPF